MPAFNILYDVTDISALIERDIRNAIYHHHANIQTPEGYDARDLLEHWYRLKLDECGCALFEHRVDVVELSRLTSPRTVTLLQNAVHPAIIRLVYRMVTLHPAVYEQEVAALSIMETLNQKALKLTFNNFYRPEEIETDACHTPRRQLRNGTGIENQLLSSIERFASDATRRPLLHH